MLTDYTAIDAETARPIVESAIAEGERLLADAIGNAPPHTYGSTLGPLDRALVVVGDAYGIGGFMARVHPDPDVRAAGAEAEELSEKWIAGLPFRRDRRSILARGGTVDGEDLLRGFLGRDPSPAAFLRKIGLSAS